MEFAVFKRTVGSAFHYRGGIHREHPFPSLWDASEALENQRFEPPRKTKLSERHHLRWFRRSLEARKKHA